jgi:hypothetical protein
VQLCRTGVVLGSEVLGFIGSSMWSRATLAALALSLERKLGPRRATDVTPVGMVWLIEAKTRLDRTKVSGI